MSVTPSPIGGFAAQFFDNNGVILSGGKIYTYAAGTTTPQASYTSASGTTPHANPIILDSAGRVPGGEIWLTDGLVYKFVIETATGILLGTYDNITGVNSNFVNYTVQEEVITATAGQTVFNLSTINYTPGTNSLTVYIDGVNQYVGDSYLETDSDTVTFTAGLHVGAEVKFTTAIQTTTGAVDASIVSYDPPFTGSVATNVQDKLAEYVSVKDFGAVGDGVVDDTAAIQAAIATGLALYFPEPASFYKIETDLTLTSPISAGLYRIFGGAGEVTIGDSTTQVFSEWWGDTTSRSTSFGPDNLSTANGIGIEQTVFGRGSLKSLTTGYANGAFGIDVLPDNTTGAFNFAFGIKALWRNTTGTNNSAFGAYSMQANLSGSANVSFGEDTNRYLESADGNVAVGVQALYNNVTGTENVAIGRYAARNASNPPDLGPATGPSPSYITAVGGYALYQAQGTFNVGVGHGSGVACSGNYNTFVGAQSGADLTSGEYNICIGYNAGNNASQAAVVGNSIAIGDNSYTTGNNAVAIGSGVSSPANIFTVCNALHTFFRPSTDNVTALGGPSNRWTVVYAATGTINTSDERDKQQIEPIDDAVLRAWAKVKFCQFKFNDAVEKKDDGARWHFGLIAQQVKDAFESEGLDAFAYGLLCHDEWEDGDRYGIRYEEALALECAYLRSKLS
jgi:hypothetical protein